MFLHLSILIPTLTDMKTLLGSKRDALDLVRCQLCVFLCTLYICILQSKIH